MFDLTVAELSCLLVRSSTSEYGFFAITKGRVGGEPGTR